MSNFRIRHFFAALVAGFCLFDAPSADAQLVRVGPFGGVNIRLPFVSVDTLPFGGGTRVRAPFTSVNTGLYGYGGPVYGPQVGAYLPRRYPVYPEPYLYADPYADRFVDVVPVYPVPVEPVFVPVPVYPAPDYRDAPFYRPDVRPRYGHSYEAARPNPADDRLIPSPYRAPYQAPSDPVAETSLTLRQAAARLDRAIERRADDADVWQDYLAPQEIVAMIDATATVDVNRMQTLLQNYEGVAGTPDLSDIWVLDGFRRTHDGLKSWLSTQGVVSDSDQNASAGMFMAPADSQANMSERSMEVLPPGKAEPESASPTLVPEPAPPSLANEPEPFDAPDRVEGAL